MVPAVPAVLVGLAALAGLAVRAARPSPLLLAELHLLDVGAEETRESVVYHRA
jgi:hypothetical protein